MLDLDSGGRRTLATTTDTSTTPSATSTLERHYADASDNPAWTVATDTAGVSTTTTTTRYGESLGGDLAATISPDGTAELTVANLHGDVVTTIDIPATQASGDPATSITGWADYTEYGAARDTAGTAAVAGTVGYGWLGAKQRSTTTETAGLTLMGDRLYNPTTGAFTSTDPEAGGNTTTYTYPQDPINMFDLDGHFSRRFWKWAKRVAVVAAFAGCIALSAGACAVVGVAAGVVSARADAGCWRCHSFYKKAAVNTAYALAGYGVGRGLGTLYERLGQGPRFARHSYSRHPRARAVKNFLAYGRRHMHYRVVRAYHPSYYLMNAKIGALAAAWGNRR